MFKIIHSRIGTDLWVNIRLRIIKRLINPGKVLDLGCGPGYIGKELENKCDVYYLDSNPDELKKINSKNKFKGYVKKTPFKNNFFDYVVCGDVLEHLENDALAIKEIYRILKKNGKAIITVPANKKFYGHHDILIGHKRRYDKVDLKNLLKKYNFKIEKLHYTCGLLFMPFLFNQFMFKKKSAYMGKSKIESKLVFILNLISAVESRLILPWGIGLLAVAKK